MSLFIHPKSPAKPKKKPLQTILEVVALTATATAAATTIAAALVDEEEAEVLTRETTIALSITVATMQKSVMMTKILILMADGRPVLKPAVKAVVSVRR